MFKTYFPVLVRIKFFREAEGMTQEELAKKSGVSQPTISRLERYEHLGGLTLETLVKLADALNCSPLDLLAVMPKPTLRRVKK